MRMPFRMRFRAVVAAIAALGMLAACGGDEVSGDGDDTTTTSSTEAAADPATESSEWRMAMIFGGPIADGDFNSVHYAALESVSEALDIEFAFSEQVGVPDADRVARQYISDGYNIIALETASYLTAAIDLAREFPDINFITVTSGQEIEDKPDNLWTLGLDVTGAEYVLGYLAAKVAGPDGTVAYLAGLDIPPLIAGANAMFAGARAAEPEIGLEFAFTGDFNDAVAARQAATELISQDTNAILMSLNAGATGAIDAIEAADGVMWYAHYTDKIDVSPDTFVASVTWDFDSALETVVRNIQEGERGGNLLLNDSMVLSEVHNADPGLAAEAQQVLDDIIAGDIEVPINYDAVEVPD